MRSRVPSNLYFGWCQSKRDSLPRFGHVKNAIVIGGQQARIERTRGSEEVEVEAFELAVDAQVWFVVLLVRLRNHVIVCLSHLLPPTSL